MFPWSDAIDQKMDRREFHRRHASACCGLALTGIAPVVSAADAPPLDIIDCHTHFYDPTRPEGVPWPGKGSSLYRTVLPRHLRALPKVRPVTGTVIVEASPWVEDNQWLLDLAADDPFIVGIVGRLTPGQADFAKLLKRFAAHKLYCGIRVGQGLADPGDGARRKDLALLVDHNLELDVNGGPDMPSTVAALARELPELRIVINHVANLPIDGQPPPANWLRAMRQAAAHPNVYCKVSALIEGAARNGRQAPRETDFYRPVLDAVWELFGDQRLIFGSNWPVSERAGDYALLQRIVLEYVSARGDNATRNFFARNAQRAYRWRDRPGRLAAKKPEGGRGRE